MLINPSLSTEETTTQPPRCVQVTRVTQLSPRMVRVTFTGDDLAAFAWNGPAAHIKLIFPEEGQVDPTMSQPNGPRSMRTRTYMPRCFDPTIPELDIESVLHGEGSATTGTLEVKQEIS